MRPLRFPFPEVSESMAARPQSPCYSRPQSASTSGKKVMPLGPYILGRGSRSKTGQVRGICRSFHTKRTKRHWSLECYHTSACNKCISSCTFVRHSTEEPSLWSLLLSLPFINTGLGQGAAHRQWIIQTTRNAALLHQKLWGKARASVLLESLVLARVPPFYVQGSKR